jgi:hypothetical protein
VVNENMERWVTALRSGEFPQAKSTLEAVDYTYDDGGEVADTEVRGYCCLGVACKIADPDNEWNWRGIDLPPADFLRWTGLIADDQFSDDEDPYVDFPEGMVDQGSERQVQMGRAPQHLSGHVTCSYLNDTLELSFEQIADLIAYFGLRVHMEGDD